jgi:aromatic amino acid aminotransferase I
VLDPENVKEDVGKTDEIRLEKYSKEQDVLSLATAMQYSSGTGDAHLLQWCHSFTQKVFQPAYSDFSILLNSGNTDGWCKVVRMLCEPGNLILVEEYTYPSSQALWIPMGCQAVPIKLDGEGMRADSLEDVLGNWETTHPGKKQPRL